MLLRALYWHKTSHWNIIILILMILNIENMFSMLWKPLLTSWSAYQGLGLHRDGRERTLPTSQGAQIVPTNFWATWFALYDEFSYIGNLDYLPKCCKDRSDPTIMKWIIFIMFRLTFYPLSLLNALLHWFPSNTNLIGWWLDFL